MVEIKLPRRRGYPWESGLEKEWLRGAVEGALQAAIVGGKGASRCQPSNET